jgi:hypothetical protein
MMYGRAKVFVEHCASKRLTILWRLVDHQAFSTAVRVRLFESDLSAHVSRQYFLSVSTLVLISKGDD